MARTIRTAAPARAIGKGGSGKPAIRQLATNGSNSGDIPEPITGLLSCLPVTHGWTQNDRDKFVATFGTVLDFCFPIVSAAALAKAETQEGADEDE